MSNPSKPRRRRGALALAAVLLLTLGAGIGWFVGSRGDGDRDATGRRADDRSGTTAVAPPTTVSPPSLEVGLVSGDAAALTPLKLGPIPGYDDARRLVATIAPRRVRIDVRWDLLQPSADQPLDAGRVVDDGCGRDRTPPCGPAISLATVIAQVAASQAEHPGAFRPLISFWGMPEWAGAAPADGCRADAARSGARPLAPGRESDYRAAIRSVWDALRAAGLHESDWTPWNEPNAPYFLDPQRAACTPDAAPTSPAAYARLVTAMDEELRALRGPGPDAAEDHRLVVGELAAWAAPSDRAVPNDEFLRGLPDDALCRADVLSLHGYFEAKPRSGRGEPVAAGLAELDRRPCLDGRPAWITETGVGAPRAGGTRDTAPATLRAECRLMDRQLGHWYHHPRVTAAFQYAVRDDAAFPTGLLDERLTRTYPVADVWTAWGGDRAADAPPPGPPKACREPAQSEADAAPPG